MNTTLWSFPPFEFPCPYCKRGTVKKNPDKKIVTSETRESLENNEYHKKGLVYPSSEQLCSEHLKCDHCGEVLIMTYIEVEDVRNLDEKGNQQLWYDKVQYYPAPPIIEIPESCPKSVREILSTSFTLYWIDKAACAGKIRVAVEEIMNEQMIPVEATLHRRIDLFKERHQDLGNLLEAVKWIGNTGSHELSLTKEAVLASYRLIEYVLEHIYNDRQRELNLLSAKINTDKGHS